MERVHRAPPTLFLVSLRLRVAIDPLFGSTCFGGTLWDFRAVSLEPTYWCK